MEASSKRKFKIGDFVNWTNSNGVNLGKREIIGLDSRSGETYFNYTYYLSPTDTPWFSIAENELEDYETYVKDVRNMTFIKTSDISAISIEKLFKNLKVRKKINGVFDVIYYNHNSEEETKIAKLKANEIAKFINGYYGLTKA